jgi:hypothetical protein
MAKKYLKVADKTIAKQKSIVAKNNRWPNWYDDQMTKHLARPGVCPHPSRYVEDPLHSWVEDPQTGECEIEMDDTDVQFYAQEDQGKMTDEPQVEGEQ